MTVNIEDLSPDDFSNLSEEQREALMRGEEAPAQEAAEPDQQHEVVAPPQAAAAVPDTQALEAGIDPSRGNPEVPLRAERERRRQLEAEIEQYRQVLNDPQALQQLMAQYQGGEEAPDLMIEEPEAIQYYVQQAVAPYAQQVQALMHEREQMLHEREMMGLRQQFPDLDQLVAEFDAGAPDLAHRYRPQEKYLLMMGAKLTDPAFIEQRITQEAERRAQALAADRLKGLDGKNSRPVTLSGVTPAQANNDEPLDINQMSPEQFGALPEAKRKALLGG